MTVLTRSIPLILSVLSLDLGDILTVHDVAEFLKIPKQTVYRMVRSGDLCAFKAGKHWRVQRGELGAFIARQSTGNRNGR